MSIISFAPCGRRVYIEGETYALRRALGSSGAHWEAGRWWIGAKKQSLVEEAVAEALPLAYREIMVLGRAVFKGRTYFVRWAGETKRGSYAFRLTTLDASETFWADAARPRLCEWSKSKDRYRRPRGETRAVWQEQFREPRSLAQLQQELEDFKASYREGRE